MHLPASRQDADPPPVTGRRSLCRCGGRGDADRRKGRQARSVLHLTGSYGY